MAPIARDVLFCEILPEARRVLEARMRDGSLDKGIIVDDVCSIALETIQSLGVHLTKAGFPCPDLSVAGFGKGFNGSRSFLFREVVRISAAPCVRILLLENVFGFLSSNQRAAFEEVIRSLTTLRFEVRWTCSEAVNCGLPIARSLLGERTKCSIRCKC